MTDANPAAHFFDERERQCHLTDADLIRVLEAELATARKMQDEAEANLQEAQSRAEKAEAAEEFWHNLALTYVPREALDRALKARIAELEASR